MPRTKISEFSATAASNTDIDSINIAEGCAPSGINDAIRELMSQLKDFQTGAVGDSFNGPVGTTTAAAGAFTTLSASSTVSGTGFSTYLASPPAIGGTAAAAGAFTTLAASGAVTLSGGAANGVAYLNGSKVVTSGSALTFDGTNLGVGTTSPASLIAIAGSTSTTLGLSITASGWNNARHRLTIPSSGDESVWSWNYTGSAIDSSSYGTASIGLTSNAIKFATATTNTAPSEQMRLTSTGLGIGTSSPAQKLHVDQTSTGSVWAKVSNGSSASGAAAGVLFGSNLGDMGAISILSSSNSPADALFLRSLSTNPLVFGTNNAEKMRLDSSGNLSLGVAPSAWFTSNNLKAFQLGGGSLVSYLNNQVWLASNYYLNSSGADTYVGTGAANRLIMDGAYKFFTAPSGTAGNAITFTQAATLDASGNFLVGTTSANGRLTVDSGSNSTMASFNSTNATGGYIPLATSGTVYGDIGTAAQVVSGGSASDFGINARGSRNLVFGSNNTERARINASGNFILNGTSVYASSLFTNFTNGSNGISNVQNIGGGYSFISNAANNGGVYYHASFEENTTQRGSIASNGTITTYATTSDYRLKTVIGAVTGHGARIDALEPIEYTWNSNGSRTRGFLAHKFQEVYADSVTGAKDAVDANGKPVYQQMQAGTAEVIADLVAEIQSLRKRLADAGI
jgi:hypothetical protein